MNEAWSPDLGAVITPRRYRTVFDRNAVSWKTIFVSFRSNHVVDSTAALLASRDENKDKFPQGEY